MGYLLKIIVAGEGGVGKTTQIIRYTKNKFLENTKMTIGVDFYTNHYTSEDGKEISLQLWDFGGEERFRFLLPNYCKGAMAAILMFDVTEKRTLYNLEEWVKILRQNSLYKEKTPILLVGNKIDLPNRAVTSDDISAVVKDLNLSGYIEGSAKTGENTARIFELLPELLLRNK